MVVAIVVVAVACSGARRATPPAAASSAPRTTASTAGIGAPAPGTTSGSPGCASRTLEGLSEAQRVGQLFMIGEPLSSADAATRQALHDLALAGVVLYGTNNQSSTAVKALTDQLRAIAKTAGPTVGLYVAADQEGGQIQELGGPGFDSIPSAVLQGVTDPAVLQGDARRWGDQLAQAGVNLDLAPVLDVVPPAFSAINQPIAQYQRQLGSTPDAVATHGVALVRGLQGAGIAAALKHFPGLGRVVGNTDTTAGVVDNTTVRRDPFVSPFAAGIKAGAGFVLVSLATYSQIDATHRGVFSSVVMRDMLRGDLGFRGLVISDDLGAARQILDVAPGERAVDFLAAGGTIVLVVKPPAVVATMVAAVEAQAAASPAFHQLVDADALAVLTAKQAAGLLTCP
jgi:beta-N-acetylhexosaminidase